MMYWGNWSGMGWWMLLVGIFWIGVILLIIWGIKEFTKRGNSSGASSSALDIARERYARGDISREEFEDIKKTL